IIASKLFTFPDQPDMTYLQSVINMFGFPLIIKEAFGSFGEQVYLVHNQDQLLQTVQKIGSQPFMFQEFIKTSYGKDMRLQVVGRRVARSEERRVGKECRCRREPDHERKKKENSGMKGEEEENGEVGEREI